MEPLTESEIHQATFDELRKRLDVLVRALLCPHFKEASRIIEALAERYQEARNTGG